MPIYVRTKRRGRAVGPQKSGRADELPFGLPRPPAAWPQKPPGISLCMIVKNEERFLGQALRSVFDAVDEIVVVDTGSTDRTIEIAKSFGAIVVEREWRNDFAWARNQAIDAASKRWIMCIDADEELTVQSKPALKLLKSAPAYRNGAWVRILNKSDDYLGTGEMSHSLIRIFPNDAAIRFRGAIHEFPTIGDSPTGIDAVIAPVSIVHHGYVKEIVEQRDKGARNMAIVRAAAEAEPDEPFHWFNLGSTAFLVDDFDTAREALEKMRSMVGTQKRGFIPNGLAVLAETYCDKLGDAAKGEEVSRDALAVAPHYANAHFQLGKALVAQGRFAEAREAYEAAIDDGNYVSQQFVVDNQVSIWKAHSEIGSTYVAEKNDEKAMEWFDLGLKNSPKAEPLHLNRAKALERLGRIEEAIATYRGVYEMHGSEQSSVEYVNALLRHSGEREALVVVEECYARVAPETGFPLLMAAAAVAQKQKSAADERYLRLAADLAPGRADVLDPLEALLRERGKESEIPALVEREELHAPVAPQDFARRARRAVESQQNERGLELARAGLELAPGNAMLSYTAAAAAARLEQPENAWQFLTQIKDCPSNLVDAVKGLRASLALQISAAYLREGRIADAAAIADAALQSN